VETGSIVEHHECNLRAFKGAVKKPAGCGRHHTVASKTTVKKEKTQKETSTKRKRKREVKDKVVRREWTKNSDSVDFVVFRFLSTDSNVYRSSNERASSVPCEASVINQWFPIPLTAIPNPSGVYE
jgi:hypothetical protein